MITLGGAKPKSSGSMVDELVGDEDKWSRVSNWAKHHNMTEDKYSREEIANSYINQMRYIDSGNFVSAGKAMFDMSVADEDKKVDYVNAFELWDNMEGGLAEGRPWADTFDTFRDYAVSVATDPTTYIGLGIGKAVTGGATKAALKLSKNGAIALAKKKVAKEIGEAAMKRSPEIVRKEANRIYMDSVKKAVTKAPIKKKLKSAGRKGALASGLTETALGATGVYMAEEAKVISGYKDKIDPMQIAFVLGTGAAVTGLSSALSKAGREYDMIYASVLAGEGADQVKTAAGKAAKNNPTKFNKALKEKADKAWQEVLDEADNKGLGGRTLDEVKDENYRRRAFLGVVEDTFVDVSGEVRPQGILRGRWLALNIDELDNKTLPVLRKNFEDFMGYKTDSDAEFFADLMDLFEADANAASSAGSALQSFGRQQGKTLKNKANNTKGVAISTVSNKMRDASFKGIGDDVGLNVPLISAQRYYIQSLVTNPATTMLNLKGWAMASTSNGIQDFYRTLWYGTRSLAAASVGDQQSAKAWSDRGAAQGRATLNQFRRLLNPESTYKELLDFLGTDVQRMNKMFYAASGGTQDITFRQLKELGSDATEEQIEAFLKTNIGFDAAPRNTGKADKLLGFFQNIYGVRIQDILTKSLEWRNAMDRRIIEEFGMGYKEFMNNPKFAASLYKVGDEGTIERFAKVESKAFDDTLKAVFGKTFGKDENLTPALRNMAKGIEMVRDIPVIGTLMPFGQFFNNTISFMSGQSGFSVLMKFVGASGKNKTYGDLFTEAAAGWTMGFMLYHMYQDDIDDGLRWNERRGSDGVIYDQQYDFPETLYRIIAWQAGYLKRGEQPPADFLSQAKDAFGASTFRGIDEGLDTIKNLWGDITKDIEEGEPAVRNALFGLGSATVDLYTQGFTRPLEPINMGLAGFGVTGEYTKPDTYTDTSDDGFVGMLTPSPRALTYVDQIVGSLLGETNVEARSPTDNKKLAPQFGKFFGFRDINTKTTIEQMMEDAGYAPWQATEYLDDPLAKQVVNSIMYPIMETRAVEVREKTDWNNLSTWAKKTHIENILTNTRKDAKEILGGSTDPEMSKTEMIWSLSRGTSKREVKQIRKKFFDNKELKDLTMDELEVFDLLLDLDKIQKEAILSELE